MAMNGEGDLLAFKKDEQLEKRHQKLHNSVWHRPRALVKDAYRSAKRAILDRIPILSAKPWSTNNDADWWFAGTAVPLLAATIGPLANVFSIAALVTPWRMCLVQDVDAKACPWDGNQESLLLDLDGNAFHDPDWCFKLNILSLALGFIGNTFLLFNFTGFVRYIIALPMTIIMWFLATGILIGITVSMDVYVPPIRPYQTYTQGFWYAVQAAVLYLVVSVLLMVNMLGYYLGYFPQHFELSDSQRTLILQTMMFFIWLAGGGGVFSKVETVYGNGSTNWSYTNALYFSDVTILTVGFGDLALTSNIGRGFVFPYSVGGIVMLGLVITSISRFATEIGSTKVIDKHRERSRARTADRVVSSVDEFRHRLYGTTSHPATALGSPVISAPFDPVNQSTRSRIPSQSVDTGQSTTSPSTAISFLQHSATIAAKAIVPAPLRKTKPRPILLAEERDRFNTMRRIEYQTKRWKSWTALTVAVFSFSLLWLLGALVFFYAEAQTQQLTYFQALYFCYVSLLTIGYGDLAPKSNVGRPFFVLWSLIAVPTMTILVSAMGDTVIRAFKRGVEKGAEVTILPRRGVLGDLFRRTGLVGKVEERKARKEIEQRLECGFETGVDDATAERVPDSAVERTDTTSTTRNPEAESTDATSTTRQPDPESTDTSSTIRNPADPENNLDLARRLASAIRSVSMDLRQVHPVKRYEYDEWLEFTHLIRSTSRRDGDPQHEDDDLIEWDWIGQDSPMMAKQSEPEFVLDRLCESLDRWAKRRQVREKKREEGTGEGMEQGAGTLEIEES